MRREQLPVETRGSKPGVDARSMKVATRLLSSGFLAVALLVGHIVLELRREIVPVVPVGGVQQAEVAPAVEQPPLEAPEPPVAPDQTQVPDVADPARPTIEFQPEPPPPDPVPPSVVDEHGVP